MFGRKGTLLFLGKICRRKGKGDAPLFRERRKKKDFVLKDTASLKKEGEYILLDEQRDTEKKKEQRRLPSHSSNKEQAKVLRGQGTLKGGIIVKVS